MKLLKQLRENQSQFLQTIDEIEEWLHTYRIRNYTINDDLTVDVDGPVYLVGKFLSSFPIQFGEVKSFFYCNANRFTSLEGSPRHVGGDFFCDLNPLKTLVGSPITVDGNFRCTDTYLESLRGAPREVNGYFRCWRGHLKSLKGAPREVTGDFDCRYNFQLKTLDGIGNVAGQIYSDVK